MRKLALFAALTLLAPAAAEARLFWQTYGATVTEDGGCGAGCSWNQSQDYFVPRHCDSGRYGLFSPCKADHSRSAACRNLHPFYGGYCTPFGSCRYKWRDHIYKTYCGCMPLRCEYGPWHLKTCGKQSFVHRPAGDECRCEEPVTAIASTAAIAVEGYESEAVWLPNVEPFGGERLGSIPALSAGATSGPAPAASPAIPVQALPPKLELTPVVPAGDGLPAPFAY
jgi:hypothetical protein